MPTETNRNRQETKDLDSDPISAHPTCEILQVVSTNKANKARYGQRNKGRICATHRKLGPAVCYFLYLYVYVYIYIYIYIYVERERERDRERVPGIPSSRHRDGPCALRCQTKGIACARATVLFTLALGGARAFAKEARGTDQLTLCWLLADDFASARS